MKRFSFRLERVLKVRQLQQQQARGQWALARAEQTAVEQRLQEMRAAAGAASTGMTPGSTFSHDGIQALALRASLRAQSVQHATADLAAAADLTSQRVAQLRSAAREVDVLDRLEDRQHEVWQIEARREETKQLDDIAGQRAGTATRTGGAPPGGDPR